jgi:hypothetical protein
MAPELNWTSIAETFIKSLLGTYPRNAKVTAVIDKNHENGFRKTKMLRVVFEISLKKSSSF